MPTTFWPSNVRSNATLFVAGTPISGLNLVAGANVTITVVGTNATIASSGGGGGGSGDVVGPSSSTDNAAARFDTTTGKLLQNSTIILGDDGSITASNFIANGTGAGSVMLRDSSSNYITISAPSSASGSPNFIFPGTTGTGFLYFTGSGTNETASYGTVTITGVNSVSASGTIPGTSTIQLANDSASPGANKVYGTDGSGVKGWKDDPSGGGGGSVTNYFTGAAAYKSATKDWYMTMNDSNGGFAWRRATPSLADRRWSFFVGGSATIGKVGQGEDWTLTGGTLTTVEATTTNPSYNHTQAGNTVGTDTAINANGFKLWQPGHNIYWQASTMMWDTNVARQWVGLTSGSATAMDSAAPSAQLASFHYEPASNTWRFVTSNGGGSSFNEVDTGIRPTPGTFQKFEIIEDTANTTWYGLINGSFVATNTTVLPTTAMQSSVSLHIITGSGVTGTNCIQRIVAAMDWY